MDMDDLHLTSMYAHGTYICVNCLYSIFKESGSYQLKHMVIKFNVSIHSFIFERSVIRHSMILTFCCLIQLKAISLSYNLFL